MNDRYLYRAKRTDNGEWVEGCLLIIDDSEYRIATSCLQGDVNEILTVCAYEVDQSTICQCTGLKDKNGKLIWENDIVDASLGWWDASGPAGHDSPIIKVEWDDCDCGFTPFADYDCDCGVYIESNDVKVIGNIFDNPELLEK